MGNLADVIKSVLLARESIGVVMALACLLVLLRNRPFIRDAWNDASRFWRIVARAAAALGLATLTWIGLFDDWLQIVAEPYRLSMRWNYQRVLFDPIDPTIRAISVTLLVLTLVAMACLFSRHIGGYLMQAGTLALSLIIWMPLFIMNQRMNAMVIQGAEASETLPEVLGVSAFWVIRMGLGTLTIAMTLLSVTMALALICTLLLSVLGLREPRVTHEADGFFSELGRRAGQREDIPLKALWRPIRRPL